MAFVTHRLGNQNLVHNGFKFLMKSKREGRCCWQYSSRNCPATINTRNNLPTKVSPNHNHKSDRMQLQDGEVLRRMKDRFKEELTAIPTIYEEELVRLRNPEWNDTTQQLVENVTTFHSCKTSLYHKDTKHFMHCQLQQQHHTRMTVSPN